jgi:hypothetical protein
MLVGSPGSSSGSTAHGAGEAGDRLNLAITGTSGHKGAPPSLARPGERATPHTGPLWQPSWPLEEEER